MLLYFRTHDNDVIDAGYSKFYDKVPLKYADYSAAQFRNDGARVVPHAVVRKGAYVGPNAVLMPSYVNIGAYVDTGAMVDTWVTVGSCAQIGKNVHLSGGVGIGGVLEPLQANPTIIEDDCFIGARSEIVEGVIVEAGSVISMGVFIGQSTKIYDRTTGEVLQGRVPAGSVVVSGQPARRRWPLLAVLRRDRQEGRRPDPGEDLHQRIAACRGLTGTCGRAAVGHEGVQGGVGEHCHRAEQDHRRDRDRNVARFGANDRLGRHDGSGATDRTAGADQHGGLAVKPKHSSSKPDGNEKGTRQYQ